MATDNIVTIRKFLHRDRKDVRRICCETALMGEPSSIFFDDDEIFADALTLYFTDYEPESSFVAEDNHKVVGYLLGAKDVKIAHKVFTNNIVLPLFFKSLFRGTFFKKKNIFFFLHVLMSLMKGEFKAPDFSRDYSATLHINIDEYFRGQGIGSKLINNYLKYLRGQCITGVHLATMSDKSSDFFVKQGFNLLFQSKRSYFRYILHKATPIYIYGRKL